MYIGYLYRSDWLIRFGLLLFKKNSGINASLVKSTAVINQIAKFHGPLVYSDTIFY